MGDPPPLAFATPILRQAGRRVGDQSPTLLCHFKCVLKPLEGVEMSFTEKGALKVFFVLETDSEVSKERRRP